MVLFFTVLAACSTSEVLLPHQVDLVRAAQPVPEQSRLDVGVVVFDPGVPDGPLSKEGTEELIERGVYPNIRRAESIQMAVQLRNALQRAGHWGSVWVMPNESSAVDIIVNASILRSDGYGVRVHVKAVDASGRSWVDRDYESATAAAAYNRQRYAELDPYQDLFNSIANDMAAVRAKLPGDDVGDVKTIGELRYARALSAPAFDAYLAEMHNGKYVPVRLPALDDPMLARVRQVRARERLFLETLGHHYEKLTFEMQPSYDSWRENSREESIAVRELNRLSRWRMALGVVALAASFASGGAGSSVAQDSLFAVGGQLFGMGAQSVLDRDLHSDVLAELSLSYDGDIEPTVLEMEGVEHRLVGTAQAQYAEWVDVLRTMFIRETGFGIDDSTDPAP